MKLFPVKSPLACEQQTFPVIASLPSEGEKWQPEIHLLFASIKSPEGNGALLPANIDQPTPL